jgi:anaerobic ribonucleoside-triphosphate reductase activating protein
MHFLTTAYSAGDERMRGANTVEVHWRDGKLVVNGWPASAAALLNRKR